MVYLGGAARVHHVDLATVVPLLHFFGRLARRFVGGAQAARKGEIHDIVRAVRYQLFQKFFLHERVDLAGGGHGARAHLGKKGFVLLVGGEIVGIGHAVEGERERHPRDAGGV